MASFGQLDASNGRKLYNDQANMRRHIQKGYPLVSSNISSSKADSNDESAKSHLFRPSYKELLKRYNLYGLSQLMERFRIHLVGDVSSRRTQMNLIKMKEQGHYYTRSGENAEIVRMPRETKPKYS